MSLDPHEFAAIYRRDVDAVPDDQLRLVFLCCHPALGADVQVALTLRLLGGLTTAEIARAFLVPEATMGQRLTRAKRKIRDTRLAYRIPTEDQLAERLGPVLATIYLIYTEGHAATAGEDLLRRAVLEHRGPVAALEALDAIALPTYHLYHATRAEALRRVGRDAEASDALRRAIDLTSNAAERCYLEDRSAGRG